MEPKRPERRLAVVLAVPGADCADMVGKDGINGDRRVVPIEGREATLKGPCTFVGSLSNSAPMENRSAD